jgi:vacuolar protein sorting-associated protein 13A/C
MLEKIFQAIMRRYFGEFLTGIENVELAFWTGKINLNNIALKHEKINLLLKAKNIPFTIKYSHIGSLSIDIPWKSLSSTPVEVKVSDVYIVLKMEQFTSVSKKIEEEKLSLIKNYIEYLIKKSLEN